MLPPHEYDSAESITSRREKLQIWKEKNLKVSCRCRWLFLLVDFKLILLLYIHRGERLVRFEDISLETFCDFLKSSNNGTAKLNLKKYSCRLSEKNFSPHIIENSE